MKKYIILILVSFLYVKIISAQTYVKSGDVWGNWDKGNSPFIITGDINVPSAKSLKIEPGVKVIFEGPYILNVQGNLLAEGTKRDSICFTVSDTSGFSEYLSGWNGIHFDPRPILWESVSGLGVQTLKKEGKKQLSINLKVDDLINDSNKYCLVKTKSRISYCRFEFGSSCKRNRPYTFGGAIYIYQYQDIIVKNSLFFMCNAYSGGAIYCKEAIPIISGNIIKNCKSISSGGGMVFIYSGPIINDNTIINNISGYNAGAILFFESCPYVINNRIFNNRSSNAGGALHIEKLTTPVILNDNFEISSNTRKSIDLVSAQNLIEISTKRILENSDGEYYNNIICKNSSIYGGGISLYSSCPKFYNSTICDNYGTNGSGLYIFYSYPTVFNSIIYNNTSVNTDKQIFVSGKSTLELRNTDLQSDINTISGDSTSKLELIVSDLVSNPPLFVDENNLNYALAPGSPCIDAGIRDSSVYLLSKKDINGNPRVINNLVDLGAIEFQPSSIDLSQKSTYEKTASSSKEILFNLFPNPTKDKLTLLVFNNPYDEILVRLYSNNGIVVFDKIFSTMGNPEMIIDLADVQSGVYVLKAIADTKEIYSNTIIME